eukprot:5786959-Amphidinium_carterae.1
MATAYNNYVGFAMLAAFAFVHYDDPVKAINGATLQSAITNDGSNGSTLVFARPEKVGGQNYAQAVKTAMDGQDQTKKESLVIKFSNAFRPKGLVDKQALSVLGQQFLRRIVPEATDMQLEALATCYDQTVDTIVAREKGCSVCSMSDVFGDLSVLTSPIHNYEGEHGELGLVAVGESINVICGGKQLKCTKLRDVPKQSHAGMTEGVAILAVDQGHSFLGGVGKSDPPLAGTYTARTPVPTVDTPANLHAKVVNAAECRIGTHGCPRHTGKGSRGIRGLFAASNGAKMQTSHLR